MGQQTVFSVVEGDAGLVAGGFDAEDDHEIQRKPWKDLMRRRELI
jgi:hypothetical protein